MNEEQTYPTNPRTEDAQTPCETLAQCSDIIDFAQRYTRERPGVVALWCLGIGFVLGWKLKPW